MPNSFGLNWNGEELSDAEVFAAIRYLDPSPLHDEPTVGFAFVICFAIILFAAACFALYSLFRLV